MIRQSVKLLILVIVSLIVSFQPLSAQSGRDVWAFYIGFWVGGSSWDSQASILTDYPAIGAYDSRDAGVAATHIDQARSAGINAFTVSWYGVDNGETTAVLNNMLDRAAERDFKIGAVVDVFNGFDRDHLIRSIGYIVNDRANHPAYLRYNGKPVILFAFQANANLSVAQWQEIRNQIDPDRNTVWIAEGLNGCCLYGGAMDGMYAFNIAWANGSSSRYTQERNAVLNNGGSVYVATVHPGWDENNIARQLGRPNPTSPRARNNGVFLTNSWNGAVSSGADVVLVVSWNEFLENSHIEPSTTYGNQSLDTLGPLIASWRGGAEAPPQVTGEQVVQSTVNLNVRTGASTDFETIGQISPRATYALLGEESGWYIIDYNGQRGYVSGQFARVLGGQATGGASPDVSPTGTVLEATAVLNVRTGASTDFESIGRINPGTTYAIVGEESGWYIIDFDGQRGYVSGQFVRVTG